MWQASRDLQCVVNGDPWYFPHERDAVIVSRSKVEEVCGKDGVRRYAEEQSKLGNNPEKWRFFLGSEAENPVNFLQATIPLLNKHREALKARFPSNGREHPDYIKERWWE